MVGPSTRARTRKVRASVPKVIPRLAQVHNGLLKTTGKNRNSIFDAIPRRQFQDYHEIHVFLSQEGSQIALQLFFGYVLRARLLNLRFSKTAFFFNAVAIEE